MENYRLFTSPNSGRGIVCSNCRWCVDATQSLFPTLDGGRRLQLCARCKVDKYCSKKCQKEHWNTHKPLCVPAEEREHQLKVTKSLQRIVANPHLQSKLAIAIAIDLMDRLETTPNSLNKFLIARLNWFLYPSSPRVLASLRSSNTSTDLLQLMDGRMMGKLRLCDVPLDCTDDPSLNKNSGLFEAWSNLRLDLNDHGHAEDHVVLVMFNYLTDNKINIPIMLPPGIIAMAKRIISKRKQHPEVRWKNEVIALINHSIENDEHDTSKMKLEMVDVDKEYLRNHVIFQ